MKSCVESGVENICHAPTSKDAIYLRRWVHVSMSKMCKKTLSIFGSGSSFFLAVFIHFSIHFFCTLQMLVSADFYIATVDCWIWDCLSVCVCTTWFYLFSQYFLSPSFFLLLLFLKETTCTTGNWRELQKEEKKTKI